MKRIDRNLYEACLVEEWSRGFGGKLYRCGTILDLGLGYVILHKGQVVSGASSHASYSAGIEIKWILGRLSRSGFGKACAAQLILACLDCGLYPSWDAHT